MTNNLMPTSKEKEQIYEIYKVIFFSSFSEQKKINLISSIFSWEPWSFRVAGITLNALIEFKKNDFRYKSHTHSRDHFVQDRKVTYKAMLDEILPFEKWWDFFWKNDKTILITHEEHNNKKNLSISKIIPIDSNLGFFKCKSLIGYHYTKKREGKFLEKLINDNRLDI